jgi:hypothetical protein
MPKNVDIVTSDSEISKGNEPSYVTILITILIVKFNLSQ